jgi:TPR repeat protein
MLYRSIPLAMLLFSLVSGSSVLLFPIATAQSQPAQTTPDITGLKRSAPKRLALVVGIDDYPESPLRLPVRDAELISKQLESVGFEVMLIKNPTKGGLIDARDSFIKKINASGDNVTALFFFAGHAVQFGGYNYLIPTKSQLLSAAAGSANAPTPGAFEDRAMDAQRGILDYLSESKASKIIFVLDACRSNPFNPGQRASGRPAGLAKMNAKAGGSDTFILFAAYPGQVAFDGANDASNSPFTEAFAFAIAQPGSSLDVVYRQVDDRVTKTTKGQQRPYQEGALFSFMFRDPPPAPVAAAAPPRLLETGFERRQYDVAGDGFQLLRQTLAKKSIEDIKKAAEGGDAEAQYLLGLAYQYGQGVAADSERAAAWLRRAATKGFSRAQFAYGSRLYWGWGNITPNKKEGFEWWLVAAENGNAAAMLLIGETYLYGREGVPGEDLVQAEKYFNQALSAGAVEAETFFGLLHGVKAEKARKAGDAKATEQATQKRLAYFQNGAQKGASSAMYQLALMYRFGDYVKVDLQKAIEWYTKSTAAGNSDAAEALAKLYADEGTGLGKAQPEEAAKYFRIALDLRSETAGVELADLIRNGKVKSKTRDEVVQLYEQAVAKGSLRAAAGLSEVYLKGELVAKDLKKAEQYGLKALELEKTVKPDSEDAWPMHARLAAYNLLKLYKEEKLSPAKPQLVKDLEARVGTLNAGMKRFTVPITCGTVKTPFYVYVWDWKLNEPPTTAQFAWVEKARGCEVPKDVVESFQKLYKIARDNNVSFSELTVYAVNNPSKKK